MTSVRKGQRSQQAVQEPTDEASTKHNQLSGSFSKMYIANPYPGIHNRNFLDWAPYSQILKYLFSEFFIEPFLKTSASAVRFQNIDKCNKYSSFALSVPPPISSDLGFQVTLRECAAGSHPGPLCPQPSATLPRRETSLCSLQSRHIFIIYTTVLCAETPAELIGMDSFPNRSSPNTEQNFYNLYVSIGWMEKANSYVKSVWNGGWHRMQRSYKIKDAYLQFLRLTTQTSYQTCLWACLSNQLFQKYYFIAKEPSKLPLRFLLFLPQDRFNWASNLLLLLPLTIPESVLGICLSEH